jgi:hypothetical protein
MHSCLCFANELLECPDPHILIGVERDILNCSAILEKYFIFLDLFQKTKDPLIANLVMTDVEFLFGNIRSLYDSLQVLISDILRHARIGKSANLPHSFADMVKLEGEELTRKYDLPAPFIEFYANTKDFFLACREIRRGFQHQQIDIPVLYCLEEGFALQKESPLFKDPVVTKFNIWPKDKIKQDGLVSLLALISFLNLTLLTHTDLISQALENSLFAPQPTVKEYFVFLRGPYINHLKRSKEFLNEQWVQTSRLI